MSAVAGKKRNLQPSLCVSNVLGKGILLGLASGSVPLHSRQLSLPLHNLLLQPLSP